jgi:vitamin B12 transporter
MFPARLVAVAVAAAFLLLAAGLQAVVPARAAAATVRVTGTVVDERGAPVEFATVHAPALRRGVATDDGGRFALDLPEGPCVLEAVQLGYQKARVTLAVVAGLAPLRLVLRDEPVPIAEVTVATSTFGKAGTSEGAVLNRMDVYMTPGGAADVFQSLRALPGINAPNEGAAVFVRGGDPKETLIRLDGAELGHPYHYEGSSGGLFAGFDTYLMKSAFFSSGGFSAKYGGVLSGVLDIETDDPIAIRAVSVGANLAGVSASTSWAFVPGTFSVLATGSLGRPRLLFDLYGSPNTFEVMPTSEHGALKALWRPDPATRLAVTYVGAADRTAVVADELNVRSIYEGRTGNDFVGLRGQRLFGTTLSLAVVASAQRYRSRWSFSEFSGVRDEDNALAQAEATWAPSDAHEVSFGVQWRGRHTRITGPGAADSTDLGAGAPVRDFATDARVDLPGAYVEDKFRLAGPLYATLGARIDRFSTNGRWTLDPRAALAWRVAPGHTVRLAGGGYHQAPDAEHLDPAYGNPALGPAAATHVIAGYEWLETDVNLRVEAYRKTYRDLIVDDASTFYAAGGRGYARGVDLFLRGSRRSLTGWLSYGYLDTRRREFDDPREVPAVYGVRHSLSLVGQYTLTPSWSVGARYAASSGRPYTPVTGATYDEARGIWRPTFAENNSGLMPAHHRLDLRITHLFSLPRIAALPASSVCVAYMEGLNVLGIRNTLEYHWNEDYTVRSAQDSYFSRRMLVFGAGLAW